MRLTRRMGPDYRACARGRLLRLFVWSSCLVAVLTLRPFAAAQDARPGFGEDEPRITTSAPIFFDKVDTVRVTPSGSVSDLAVRTASAGLCELQSTYTDADFDGPGDFSIVFGLAETEIFAASYTLASEFFPIEIQSVEMVFAQTGVEDTVTELELLILKGTPDQNQIVGAPIPHTLDFTTTEADAINVLIDLSANPVLVENNGTNTFSVGFRIVTHNNQTENPCSFNPPPNSNAFPTVDASGVQHEADNWLFLVNCGPLSCPAFWNPFETLGSCAPVGDWVLRATWAPTVCPVAGACCFENGDCLEAQFESECVAQKGDFQGPETVCDPNPCRQPIEACCFAEQEGCVDLDPEFCTGVGASPAGPDTSCDTFTCFPTGACCKPNGFCLDDVSVGECEDTEFGNYQGDDTTCNNTTCPDPEGACCFNEEFCIVLTESSCEQGGATWHGPLTDCEDGNGDNLPDECQNVPIGACCLPNFTCADGQTSEDCAAANGAFQGTGSECADIGDECVAPTGACCLPAGQCLADQSMQDCVGAGGVYQGDGSDCTSCATQACCFEGAGCLDFPFATCADAGGTAQGAGTTCANTQCPLAEGACCFESELCLELTLGECNQGGASWLGGDSVCEPNPCEGATPVGGCCAVDGSCSVVTEADCGAGSYLGDGTVCAAGECCLSDPACDDGDLCNGAETCLANVCQNGTQLDCDDLDACTLDSCDAVTGCAHEAVDCTGAGDQCNTASCDPAGADGNCDILTQQPDDTPCDDQNACTDNDICTSGVCGGTAVDCSGAGGQCNTASCDPGGAEGNCDTLTPVADGTLCSDGEACTDNDQCTAGNCGGTAVDCTAADDQCNIASCNPAGADGNCDVLTPEPDGTLCDDQDACTESDICTSGVCSGAAVDCTGAGDQCIAASCDPAGAEGNCDILTQQPDGTLCDDQDDCTENDQCTAGLCGGAPIMPCCGNDITEDGEQCDPPDGTTCDENCQFLPTGACCKITGNCQEAISENACNAAGGTYQGDGSICEPDLCPPCIPTPGAAQNDCCADAIPIFTGLTSFNTTNSNTDGPIHLGVCQFDGQTYNDIWYEYLADCTVDTIVSTCEDLGAGADYDTDLVVYDGCDCDNLVLLGCNDDDPDNPCGGAVLYHSTVTVSMIAGQCYLVRAGGWFDPDFGTGTLLIEPQCGACCQGDACIDNQDSQDCGDAGGVFQGAGSACVGSFGEIDCTITGACCTTGGGCAQTTFQGCAEQSGDYQSDGTICDPDPCGCGDCPTDGPVSGPNGSVGPEDLAYLLGNWGPFSENPACDPECDPELICIDDLPPNAGNEQIGPEDLAKVLGTWGPCQ